MRSYVLPVLAALSCPCHLPLVAVLLAGTALGGVIAHNLPLFFALFAVLFAGSLWLWARELAPSSGNPTVLSSRETTSALPRTEPLRVQILKTAGCASCAVIERDWETLRPRYDGRVQAQVVDLLDHPEVAAHYRVLRSPAVVIDGRLRAQGRLDAARLQRLLDEALHEGEGTASAEEDAGV